MTILLILLSTVGLVFSGGELFQSYRSYRDVRNRSNGRHIVAQDMLNRAMLILLLFLLLFGIGVFLHFLAASTLLAATQLALRDQVLVPTVVGVTALLLLKLISSTVTRIRLEREDSKNE